MAGQMDLVRHQFRAIWYEILDQIGLPHDALPPFHPYPPFHQWLGPDETSGMTIAELLGPDTPNLTDRIDATQQRINQTLNRD